MKFKLLAILLTIGIITSCGEKKSYVTIETEFGNLKVELYESTPKHKDNMMKLAKEGYYKDLLFHRVIKGFMVQGGDPKSKDASPEARLGGGGPGYRIDAEIGAPHFKGTIAAARTGGAGNPEKMSSGSQFYLVHGKLQTDAQLDSFEKSKGFKYNAEQREKYKTIGGTPALDMEYTVYGEVVEGFDLIDKLANVPTQPGDRPVKDVKMNIVASK
ncbi:MAG: peptidylprolyl isomerase [Saprospiraceae bacterium]